MNDAINNARSLWWVLNSRCSFSIGFIFFSFLIFTFFIPSLSRLNVNFAWSKNIHGGCDNALKILSSPTITSQPISQTDCRGNKVDFMASYSAIGTVNYQWQCSTDNGTTWSNIGVWPNITGASGSTTTSPLKLGVNNIGVGGSNGVNLNGYRYRVVITDGNGFSVTSNSATLTVNEIATISPGVTSTTSTVICAGRSFSWSATITGSTPISYQWLKNGSPLADGTVKGVTISGSAGAVLNVTNASTSESGSYSVQIYFNIIDGTGIAKTCHITSNVTRNVTVNPTPVISAMTATACSGVSFSSTPGDVTNGTVPAGTTYSWPAPVVTGGITGAAAGSGSSINGALNNPTNTAKLATYTITPVTGSCTGSSFTLTITVNPTPAINGMTATTCSGIAYSRTPVNGTNGIVPGATGYTWSMPVVTGNISGGTAGSGVSINGTLNNPTNSAQTASYPVIPKTGSCTGSSFTVIVTVNPKPTPIIYHN